MALGATAELVPGNAYRIRAGAARDLKRLHELLFNAPQPEYIAVAGGLVQARALGPVVNLVQAVLRGSQTFVCEVNSEVVGVIQTREGGREVWHALVPLWRAAWRLLRTYGVSGLPGI